MCLGVLPEDSASIIRCRMAFSNEDMAGFTLIEVLIALVVISIGVLGLISLQIHTLSTSHHAYLASITSIQAMDLEERMRANPTAASTYVNAKLSTSKIGNGNTDCSTYCTPKQLAVYDLDYKHQWLSTTYSLLPASLSLNLYGPGNKHCNSDYELVFNWQKHNVSGFGSAATTNTKKTPVFHYCFQL